jgi:NADH-quinone oxidoreductase subunit K
LNLEIILLANGLNFIVWSFYLHNPSGEIYALLLLAIAVAETSVGLSLLLCSSKLKSKIDFKYYSNLRG